MAKSLGEYRCSTRGATLDQVGFIHASTAAQLPAVANAFYNDATEPLVVLVLDDEAIRSSGTPVRYEDGGDGQLYPHIYGPIRTDLVLGVRSASFSSTGQLTY